MLRLALIPALAVATFLAAPAHAFCMYKNVMYARTTLAQEFRDAPLVVRARVLSRQDFTYPEGWGSRYRLKLEATYKGKPPPVLTYISTRDSGGFYLDRNTRADLGTSYLLFLEPYGRERLAGLQLGRWGRGAWWINYSCGQSRPWREVSASDRARLVRLRRSAPVRARR